MRLHIPESLLKLSQSNTKRGKPTQDATGGFPRFDYYNNGATPVYGNGTKLIGPGASEYTITDSQVGNVSHRPDMYYIEDKGGNGYWLYDRDIPHYTVTDLKPVTYPFKVGDRVTDAYNDHWKIVQDYGDGTYAVETDLGHKWHMPGWELEPDTTYASNVQVNDPAINALRKRAPYFKSIGTKESEDDVGTEDYEDSYVTGDATEALKSDKYFTEAMGSSELGSTFKNVDTKVRVVRRLASRLYNNSNFNALSKDQHLLSELDMSYTVSPTKPETAVSGLIKAWARTSSKSPISCVMQDLANDEFNIADASTGYQAYAEDSWTQDMEEQRANVLHYAGTLKEFLRQMYEETQAMFQHMGITHVYVYRGMRWGKGTDAEGYELDTEPPDGIQFDGELHMARLRMQPMSSFSFRLEPVHMFAGVDNNSMFTSHSLYITAKIPVTRVLGTALTGYGCLEEGECVVLGGEMPVRYIGNNYSALRDEGYGFDEDESAPSITNVNISTLWGKAPELGTSDKPVSKALWDTPAEELLKHITVGQALGPLVWINDYTVRDKRGERFRYLYDANINSWLKLDNELDPEGVLPEVNDTQFNSWNSMEYCPSVDAWYSGDTHRFYQLNNTGVLYPVTLTMGANYGAMYPTTDFSKIHGVDEWVDITEPTNRYHISGRGIDILEGNQWVSLADKHQQQTEAEQEDADPESAHPTRNDIYPLWGDMFLVPEYNAWYDIKRGAWLRPNVGRNDSFYEIIGWGNPSELDTDMVPFTALQAVSDTEWKDMDTGDMYEWIEGEMPKRIGDVNE